MGEEEQSAQPPTAAGAPMSPQGQPLAEWWKRLVAWIIDYVVIVVPSWIIMTVFSFGIASRTRVIEPTFDLETGQFISPGSVVGGGLGIAAFFIALIVVGGLGIAYYVFFHGGEKGQTLGKMAMKIRLVDEATGDSIGYGPAFLRWLVLLALAIPCYIGFILSGLWPLWDDKRQTLHDKAVKSLVIDIG